jgi:UDP-hydrolysing UDP-N-acetyl-D-glucosamine 2-epimerase
VSKKICVISGSRADYGLLKKLIANIGESPLFSLQLVITGAHHSNIFGFTKDEILMSPTMQVEEIEIDVSFQETQNLGIVISQTIEKFSRTLERTKPDLVIVLGDRYEVFGAAVSSISLGIPVAHIHGGEVTSGSKDEMFRHAITKLSSIHFVANAEFENRVIQMGEDPKNVYDVGGLGVDAISSSELLRRDELEEILGVSIISPFALMTFHPDSINPNDSISQLGEVLKAISQHPDVQFIITASNADVNGVEIINQVRNFSESQKNVTYVSSLGQQKYYSLLSLCEFVLGNSSSGLLEAPTFKIPTINIGSRQDGRPRAKSVVDVSINSDEISNAIFSVMSKEFQSSLQQIENPYGSPGASQNIVEILKQINFTRLLPKRFNDIISRVQS